MFLVLISQGLFEHVVPNLKLVAFFKLKIQDKNDVDKCKDIVSK